MVDSQQLHRFKGSQGVMIGSGVHGGKREDDKGIRVTLMITNWFWKIIKGLLWARGQVPRRMARSNVVIRSR